MATRTPKKPPAVAKANDFSSTLKKFRAILKKYEKRCVVDVDSDEEYHLNFKPTEPGEKSKFFAGTGVNKATISFYLAPINADPVLRASLSAQLKKHLSGKCCLRFRKSDPIPFTELAALTKRGFEHGQAGD